MEGIKMKISNRSAGRRQPSGSAPAILALVALAMLLGFALVMLRSGLSAELTIATCMALGAVAVKVTRTTTNKRRTIHRTARSAASRMGPPAGTGDPRSRNR